MPVSKNQIYVYLPKSKVRPNYMVSIMGVKTNPRGEKVATEMEPFTVPVQVTNKFDSPL